MLIWRGATVEFMRLEFDRSGRGARPRFQVDAGPCPRACRAGVSVYPIALSYSGDCSDISNTAGVRCSQLVVAIGVLRVGSRSSCGVIF